jgi:Holliday junction resolvase RusA-like endonuclease
VTVPIIIELPGEPKAKGRPRFSRRSGHAYTPAATVNYESHLKLAGIMAMGAAKPLEGPLEVLVVAAFSVPASWSKGKRLCALSGVTFPTVKPDADNLLKMMDALNEVVWLDDKQIVRADIRKVYSERPCLTVHVRAAA